MIYEIVDLCKYASLSQKTRIIKLEYDEIYEET